LSFAAEGATPETPMKGAPGMRTPGICSDVAQPWLIFPVHQERRIHDIAEEPEAGDAGAPGHRLGHDLEELDLEGVAGLRALDVDGAGQGMHRHDVELREIRRRLARRELPSRESRVSMTTSSPSPTSMTGSMSG